MYKVGSMCENLNYKVESESNIVFTHQTITSIEEAGVVKSPHAGDELLLFSLHAWQGVPR